MFRSKKLIPKEEHDLRVEIAKYEIYLSEAKNKLKGRPSPFYTPMFSCPGETIEMIRTWRTIQGTQGNWDADDYMLGMFNGIEMCLAALENREPDFRTRVDQPFAFDEEGNLPNLGPVFSTPDPIYNADDDKINQEIINHINELPAHQEE
jgi:hypothetical protein